MQQQPRNMSLRGAVDLAALKAAGEAKQKAQDRARAARESAGESPGGGAAPDAAGLVVDVDEAGFEAEILERSALVPVVVDFWAEWCEPCKQLSPVLEKLAAEYNGAFVLAKLDIEANPALAQGLFQQLGVQGIPFVLAVVGGQPVPLFQGAVPMDQARRAIEQLIQVAEQQFGIVGAPVGERPEGAAGEAGDGADAEPVDMTPEDPALAAAHSALDADDLAGAVQAYKNVLADRPADVEARVGLAQAELMLRTRGLDAKQVRIDAAAQPNDVDAQIRAADLDLIGGHVEDAFGRLVDTVGRVFGEPRNTVRLHLLGLFELIGTDDARVAAARSALARKLF
jgi:putative thioredoxin